jgi:D-alanyl-D-alanine dipeptidase
MTLITRKRQLITLFVGVSSPRTIKQGPEFYPYLEKSRIIPECYLAMKSGHSRGSTVDLTFIPLGQSFHEIKLLNYTLTDETFILYRDGTELMDGHFDYFGELSHHDTTLIRPELL